jgi:hypothetical protein
LKKKLKDPENFGWPHHIKGTKTNKPNKKVMTPLIRQMLLELKNERPAGCKFFFHHRGKMLRYQMIRLELFFVRRSLNQAQNVVNF